MAGTAAYWEVQATLYTGALNKAENVEEVATKLIQADWKVIGYTADSDDLRQWFGTSVKVKFKIEKLGSTESQARKALANACGTGTIIQSVKAFAGSVKESSGDVVAEVVVPTAKTVATGATIVGGGLAMMAGIGGLIYFAVVRGRA